MKGKVKFFNVGKGFGFITGEDEKDYFVHISKIEEGINLKENDTVEFKPAENDRGLAAENVKKVSDSDDEESNDEEENFDDEEEDKDNE
jgi:cold shock protein